MTGRIVLSVVIMAAVAGCPSKRSCPPPPPAPEMPQVTGAVITEGASGVALASPERILWMPMSVLPPGTRSCAGAKCDELGGKQLREALAMLPPTGCPCALPQCLPYCKPLSTEVIGAPAPNTGVLVENDGRFAFVIPGPEGKSIVIALPADTVARSGGKDVALRDVLAVPGGCPCALPQCLPYCRPAADELSW